MHRGAITAWPVHGSDDHNIELEGGSMMTRKRRRRGVSLTRGRKEAGGAARISGRDEGMVLSIRCVLRYCQVFGLLR